MTVRWEKAMTDELNMTRILQDHAQPLAALQTRERRKNGEAFHSVMWDRAWNQAVNTIIPWMWHLQLRFDDLTVAEAIEELRKEEGSIYWPVKAADPRLWAYCEPCGRKRLTDKEALCSECGNELI